MGEDEVGEGPLGTDRVELTAVLRVDLGEERGKKRKCKLLLLSVSNV